ncbi:MAG TPA: tetratricopeptide repeat protein [Bryobacteraceae bacterium]|jgi:predicted Zn-dependent protease
MAWLSALFACLVIGQPSQQDALTAKAREARDLMAAGRFDAAIPICQELVKAVPGNPGLVLNLALAQHMAGREHEAIPNFEIVLKAQPNSLPALLSLGAARLALNQPADAIAPLQKALAAEPDNTDARGMLATALAEAKRSFEAAAQYRLLTDKTPDDPRAWYGLGMSYQALSTDAFEQMEKADPASAWVAALVADSRVQRRQYRSAFFFYSEALKQLPKLHGVHAAMAEIYRKTGHPEWASEEDTKERSLAPADCAAHPLECRFVGGKDLDILSAKVTGPKPDVESLYWRTKAANELAMQAFFRLGQLPESLELHQLRAEIARDSGRPMEAVAEWRAALKLMPGNPRAQQELAISLFMASDYRAAFDAVSDLLKTTPSPELNFIAGDSLLRLEEPERAEPYLRTALKSDPKMAAAAASLGLALSRLGRNSEAVPLLEKSLELDDDGSLHYQLARAYQAAGQLEKARAAMAKYQELVERNQKAKEEVAREAQIGPPDSGRQK